MQLGCLILKSIVEKEMSVEKVLGRHECFLKKERNGKIKLLREATWLLFIYLILKKKGWLCGFY